MKTKKGLIKAFEDTEEKLADLLIEVEKMRNEILKLHRTLNMQLTGRCILHFHDHDKGGE